MTLPHRLSLIAANLIGLLLIAGVLFGWKVPLKEWFDVDRNLRDVCVALWAILIPAWFTIEEHWAPKSQPELDKFRARQQFGRYFWTLAGTVILFGILGMNPPK